MSTIITNAAYLMKVAATIRRLTLWFRRRTRPSLFFCGPYSLLGRLPRLIPSLSRQQSPVVGHDEKQNPYSQEYPGPLGFPTSRAGASTESKGLARNSSAIHRRCLSRREVDLTAVKGGTETHPSSRSFGLDYPSLGPRDVSARAGLGRGY
jgi:hypothetical protein